MPDQDDEQKPDTIDRAAPTETADQPTRDSAADSASATPENSEPGTSDVVMGNTKPPGNIKRFFAGYWRHKKWTLPLTLLVVIALVFLVPASRYPLLALKLRRQFNVAVIDSTTHTPVSGASVSLDGKTLLTNNEGDVVFTAKVGKRTLMVHKQYYTLLTEPVFVGVTHRSTNVRIIRLVATGRQVPIKVINRLNGQPVANADLKVLNTEAKTDGSGKAIIVLPSGTLVQAASLSANGYNALTTKVQVTDQTVPANTFALTPTGRVYFLSNLSGNIDVVSTNLDGSARQTVLAGTGSEDPNDTVLLASTDWKYLALLSKRDGGANAKLFLINTSTNQLTTIDGTASTFSVVGWDDHDFIYQSNPDRVQAWQNGYDLLKSYNADTGKDITLDASTASGSTADNYISDDLGYSTDIVSGSIIYTKEWHSGFDAAVSAFNNKQDEILSVNPDGTGKQTLKSISSSNDISIAALNYSPTQLYFQVTDASGNTYYVYQNGSVTQTDTMTNDLYEQYEQDYPTYLLSPSGNQTFWSEQRDGENTLFVGDNNGNNAKQIATLSSYSPYGWYGSDYLLVEKSGSQLFVMPVNGGTALKVSDYYKPPQNFSGYGSGYGGL